MSEELKPDVIKSSDVVDNVACSESGKEIIAGKDNLSATETKPGEVSVKENKISDSVAVDKAATEEEKKSVLTETPLIQDKSEVELADKPKAEGEEDDDEQTEETSVNYAELTLAQLTNAFETLSADKERMKKSKEAEAIKAAFYKKLSKEKAEAGYSANVDEPDESSNVDEEAAGKAVEENAQKENPFEVIESGFKAIYNKFKKERADYNRKQELEREDNLKKKEAVIEDLKALIEKQEDVNATFPDFRAIQTRWREIGPVPVQSFRDLNNTYQFYVEQFYDKVQINRDMRDLDFKKNLEAKEEFCQAAEKLSDNKNVLEAFKELQKLHEQWKEYGPVAKEFRDQIWDRFKAATAVINKKYQAYFEDLKTQHAENLEAKKELCEKVEAIANKEDIKSSNEWNSLSKEIADIQKEWRTIGFATKKENQNIYDRFRAACDKFFERKRLFYTDFKDSMNANLDKKMALIEQAESIKTSTEWRKTTDQFINLQKQWKEIGAVPRKKSEQLWKRFRAACDEFFTERDKQNKPENDFYGNLKAKKALIDEIKAFNTEDATLKQDAAQSFNERWLSIGFVPFKEKDSIAAAFKEAMSEKFPDFQLNSNRDRGGRPQKGPLSEKDRLVQKYNRLQQDIDTCENNIGFFTASKTSAALIQQMEKRIEAAKKELASLEEQIRNIEETQE